MHLLFFTLTTAKHSLSRYTFTNPDRLTVRFAKSQNATLSVTVTMSQNFWINAQKAKAHRMFASS